jgi:S-adenosylmethionine-diacylglycerol 3-amino-3-carboxypropyl transferase
MDTHGRKHPFYSRLSYSFGNEDPNVERKALMIKPKDRVLCITASGDRPLHLLLDECEEVVAIDLNETQNHLLALKTLAMKHFDFENYILFLGAYKDRDRISKLHQLLPHFNDKESHFWNNHRHLVSKGVLYQGSLEKMLSLFGSTLKVFRGKKIKQLFSIEDLDEQRKFVKEKWNTLLWRKAFDLLFNSPIMRFALKDPGLFAFLGTSISPGTYLYNRMNHSLQTNLANENALLSLILRGRVEPKAFPPYLTEEGVNVIKPRLSKLKWHSENIITYLESSPDNHFDAYSLSDIASYMDHKSFNRLLAAVHRTARPVARFSIRQFMSDHPIAESVQPFFARDTKLEANLEAEERCFFYRFMAGTIRKSDSEVRDKSPTKKAGSHS